MDFLDAADCQNIPCGRTGELVRAMAGADGNGQRIKLSSLHKSGGFFGVGQHLAVVEFAFCAHTVFLASLTGFQVAQTAQFTLDGYSAGVRHIDHFAGDVDVVLKAGRGLAVFHQRAVHHD